MTPEQMLEAARNLKTEYNGRILVSEVHIAVKASLIYEHIPVILYSKIPNWSGENFSMRSVSQASLQAAEQLGTGP